MATLNTITAQARTLDRLANRVIELQAENQRLREQLQEKADRPSHETMLSIAAVLRDVRTAQQRHEQKMEIILQAVNSGESLHQGNYPVEDAEDFAANQEACGLAGAHAEVEIHHQQHSGDPWRNPAAYPGPEYHEGPLPLKVWREQKEATNA